MRRRNKRDREGDGPSRERTPMPWILMPWQPNNETRQWRKDYALDAESRATSVEIAQQRKDPQWARFPRVMPWRGHQQLPRRRRRWVGRSYTPTFEALRCRWMRKRRKIFWMKQKKRVFNSEGRFDIDLSSLGHLLCKHHENYVKFNLSSYFDKSRWE